MKRRKKQLLGLLGLAIVFLMTAIAYALPSPNAAAQSASDDVTIKVTVQGPSGWGSVKIDKPTNGFLLRTNLLEGVTSYSGVVTLIHEVSCTGDESGTQYKAVIDTYNVRARTAEASQYSYTYNLASLVPEDATCILCAYGYTAEGNGVAPDYVEFKYRALDVEVYPDQPNGDGDPLAVIHARTNVSKIYVMVYYAGTDQPLFVGANGAEEPIIIPGDKIIDGEYSLYLPMLKYGAPDGDYDLVVISDPDDETVSSMNVVRFHYTPPNIPVVPGTGTIFGDLNISRADFIITGLIAFGAVTGFAVFLLVRRRRR